jgi:hypothetical protein
MNDEFTQQQAQHFADRVIREAGDDSASRIARAMQLALGRPASLAEVHEARAFLDLQAAGHRERGSQAKSAERVALADFCHVLINSNEFAFVD